MSTEKEKKRETSPRKSVLHLRIYTSQGLQNESELEKLLFFFPYFSRHPDIITGLL